MLCFADSEHMSELNESFQDHDIDYSSSLDSITDVPAAFQRGILPNGYCLLQRWQADYG